MTHQQFIPGPRTWTKAGDPNWLAELFPDLNEPDEKRPPAERESRGLDIGEVAKVLGDPGPIPECLRRRAPEAKS
jgi:hypothetical protein